MKLSHRIIKSLYEVISWYQSNRGAGKAAIVLNYYNMWKGLHALSINVSKEAWEAIKRTAQTMNINLRSDEKKWFFLYSVETYLHLIVRILALSKLGLAPQNLQNMIDNINSHRGIFPPSVFEWVHEAYNDQSLTQSLRDDMVSSINAVLQVVLNLNTITLTVDIFRELYQKLIPKEFRRSLGEFYTKENVVDEVLDSAGLNDEEITKLYEEWRRGDRNPIILDPACGSGSFLIRVIKRIFGSLKCKSDIARFIEETLVGIDVNPFAVEMAKLNVILAISDGVHSCRAVYVPTNIRVYWADSLAVLRRSTNLNTPLVVIKVPVLAQISGSSELKVPKLPNVSVSELIDNVYRATESGEFQILLKQLNEKIGEEYVDTFRNELKELYDALSEIRKSGNARLIELIKNSIVVSDLIGNCDYVIGNPPWVRIHKVAPRVMKTLKDNYKYFGKDSVYDPSFKRTKTPFKEQHDYSLAFVERGLEFLRNGGVLSYVITSKVLKSMYAGKMREDLISNYKVLMLRDYSLYEVPLFQDAINYPLIIAVKKERPGGSDYVKIHIVNTAGNSKDFYMSQEELSLEPRNRKSPWIMAPPQVVSVLRKIQRKSGRLGDIYEIFMGVKTSADELYVVKDILGCSGNNVRVVLGNRTQVEVEANLLHPFVRGRDVDPFRFSFEDYIIFPHDTQTLEPLWDDVQRLLLKDLGVLTQNTKVESSGATLIYNLKKNYNKVQESINNLRNKGFNFNPITPCAVEDCYEVIRGSNRVLDLRIEDLNSLCKLYVEGLRIPGAPRATRYFLNHLDKLIRRDDYRTSLPPWAVFRVSRDKFRDYRIAWQEISKHFEACILPTRTMLPREKKLSMCGSQREVLIVPDVTIYFITEENVVKALKMLLYLNSDLAKSLLKLRAWCSRGGYYRHQATSVGYVPVPMELLGCGIWEWIQEKIQLQLGVDLSDLNKFAEMLYKKYARKLISELIEVLGITEEEYKELREYSKWLNELGGTEQALEGEEEEN